ncbi:2Fe-2S iron-sulfur cluster-binding protein [Streptomyces sp. NPDC002643]
MHHLGWRGGITLIDDEPSPPYQRPPLSKSFQAADGETVTQAAMNNLVPGIVAECGGYASCATCHVYVDEAWTDRLPAPEEAEEVMVEAAFDVRPTSLLSSHVQVTPETDGLIVHLPASQTGA